jgi:hypothetical protein
MSGYPISIIGLCQEGKSSPEALQGRGYRNLIHRRVVLTSRPWFLSLGEPDFHLLVQLLRPPRLGLCFPASLAPNDAMTKVLPLADEPKKAYYLEDWDKAKGYTQPLPFAEGKSITLGVDDALARVNVVSDTANLMLLDGRDRAQNGWFVLRSLIPSGKTTGAIVWHIRPDVIPNWTRPPMIAHSQVGYARIFLGIYFSEFSL